MQKFRCATRRLKQIFNLARKRERESVQIWANYSSRWILGRMMSWGGGQAWANPSTIDKIFAEDVVK